METMYMRSLRQYNDKRAKELYDHTFDGYSKLFIFNVVNIYAGFSLRFLVFVSKC